MYELTPSQFSLARPLFDAASYGALTAGTLDGGHPGRVFVDDPLLPTAALVCTRVGYYFLAGSPEAAGFIDRMAEAFTSSLAPQQLHALGDPQILLFYPNDEWKSPLFKAFEERRPIQISKKRMLLNPDAARKGALHEQLPEGMRVVSMTPEFFQNNPELASEAILFWGSEDAFTQKSLGICLVDDQAGGVAASACWGVFVGSGEIEISICTDPAYRRRGLARIAASAFIEACQERGLLPVWGCFPENQPSVQLARQLGFVDQVEQPICLWEWRE